MKTLIHPYSNLTGGEWLRGNLHTHTRQSDGTAAPQDVIADYAGRGYGFLMLSDHDVYTSEEVYRQWDSHGLVLIPGNELAAGPHLLHVDADRKVDSRPSRQEMLNEISAAPRGFAIVNHPNWQEQFDHATIAQMREWTGYLGLEIYNGIISVLDGSPYATNKWDMLLSEGRRLWGFANDDSHGPHLVEMGWNTAYVQERSVAGVVDALRNGRFYASTGVTISKITVEGLTIRLETENAQRIVALQQTGKRFAVVDAAVIEVQVPEDAKYVRFECWGAGEQFAWTQPFYVEATRDASSIGFDFIPEWQVSRLLEHGTLDTASPEEAASLPLTPLPVHPASRPTAGFADVRSKTGAGDGLVYLQADVRSDWDTRGVLKLGYDGPIRAWVNGRQVFAGPGANPALPDKAVVYADFHQGTNRVLVALDTNGGKAWGIFGRVVL
ncbi:MAG: CehA/McbA family metallohydrolase domain-containing protein [Armatimonadota bacterium]